jgi:hypothetical protein
MIYFRQMCGRWFSTSQWEGQEDAKTADDLLESTAATAEPAVPAHAVPGAT